MLLDGEGVIRTINPRAVRLLQLPVGLVCTGVSRCRLSAVNRSCAGIDNARRQQRLQRPEWQHGEQELEALCPPR